MCAGVVAVSIAERLTFDERIDQAAKVIMTPSLILIWSFTDPIHPQVMYSHSDQGHHDPLACPVYPRLCTHTQTKVIMTPMLVLYTPR